MAVIMRGIQIAKQSNIYPLVYSAIKFQTIHTSHVVKGTHDYKREEFIFSQTKLQHVVENSKNILNIRKHTNTVIRLAEQSEADESGETVNKFHVVGTSQQRKKAVDLLNSLINGKEIPNLDTSKENHNKLIWHGYKRNYKGQFAPLKPRKKCIRCGGKMLSGNPCPICQMKLNSDYNIHYTDIEILNQFICPYTWEILSPYKTNVCREQHRSIEKAIVKARKYGLIPFTIPLPTDEPKKFKPAGVPTDRNIKVKVH